MAGSLHHSVGGNRLIHMLYMRVQGSSIGTVQCYRMVFPVAALSAVWELAGPTQTSRSLGEHAHAEFTPTLAPSVCMRLCALARLVRTVCNPIAPGARTAVRVRLVPCSAVRCRCCYTTAAAAAASAAAVDAFQAGGRARRQAYTPPPWGCRGGTTRTTVRATRFAPPIRRGARACARACVRDFVCVILRAGRGPSSCACTSMCAHTSACA